MSSPYDPYGTPPGYPSYPSPGYRGYPPQQRGYLQGAPVGFPDAIRLQLANVFNFDGRASRSAYWWYALAAAVTDVVLMIIGPASGSPGVVTLLDLVTAIVGLSALSVAARRLHDSNKSAWLLLLALVPVVGGIALLVLYLLPGTPGPNRFG